MAKSTRHEVVTRDTELLNTCSRSGSEASLRPFSSSLEEIVPGAIRNINASEVFAESLRSELNNKQLLDEVEHDIMNNQNRGLCYLPKPKAEVDNTDTRF